MFRPCIIGIMGPYPTDGKNNIYTCILIQTLPDLHWLREDDIFVLIMF